MGVWTARVQGLDVQKYRDSIKEKDGKINELMEDLGNKELLLSEAQASLAKVGAAAGWLDEGRRSGALTCQSALEASWLQGVTVKLCPALDLLPCPQALLSD